MLTMLAYSLAQRFWLFQSHYNTVSELIQNADGVLFYEMCNTQHSLHYSLQPRRTCDNLRSRGHSFDLSA